MTNTSSQKNGSQKIGSQKMADYLGSLAARQATPGGGSAAAICGAQASALTSMVANFTKGNEEAIAAILARSARNTDTFLILADDDMRAFKGVMKANPEQLQSALHAAAMVPVEVIQTVKFMLQDLEQLALFGNRNLITDVAIAAELLIAAIASSEFNVRINLKQLVDQDERFEQALSSAAGSTGKLRTLIDEISTELMNS